MNLWDLVREARQRGPSIIEAEEQARQRRLVKAAALHRQALHALQREASDESARVFGPKHRVPAGAWTWSSADAADCQLPVRGRLCYRRYTVSDGSGIWYYSGIGNGGLRVDSWDAFAKEAAQDGPRDWDWDTLSAAVGPAP